jgi:hypothetical protein
MQKCAAEVQAEREPKNLMQLVTYCNLSNIFRARLEKKRAQGQRLDTGGFT